MKGMANIMKSVIETYINRLEHLILESDKQNDEYIFQDAAFDIIDEIKEFSDAIDYIEPIFLLIERSPAIDYGTPGPFASFLERFYHNGYEEKLVESIKRKPKEYTRLLLERLCMDESNPNLEEYKNLLNSVMSSI